MGSTLCNGQYPTRSFERDREKWLSRADIVPNFAGVMVKSQRQAERFASLGVHNIAVTGELRFEQPIPENQITAGRAAVTKMAKGCSVVGLASVVAGEDDLFISAMKSVLTREETLFIYVPRAPERFDETVQSLSDEGFAVARRSEVFTSELSLVNVPNECNVLVGDSLGEMYFYLAMCDRVLVGGGFTSKGSHNISEPLAVGKPVIVGPEVWTIEFPVVEAIAAGVCAQADAHTLAAYLAQTPTVTTDEIESFMASHGGAVSRTRAAIAKFLAVTSR